MEKLNNNKTLRKSLSILLWIIVWQIFSSIIAKELLIASPTSVVKSLIRMSIDNSFWTSIWFTLLRVSLGFLYGMIIGVLTGVLASKNAVIRDIIWVPMSIIKSVPVASFIIIALIWINSKNLSICISFLMVLPIFYTNTVKGIQLVNKQLLQMSNVFNVGSLKKIRYIYIPEVMPYFISASTVSLGLCWKAGIAAEVIGIPAGSIGEKLYQSKILLNTSELFAWTIVIIFMSIIFEKIFLLMIKKIELKIYC